MFNETEKCAFTSSHRRCSLRNDKPSNTNKTTKTKFIIIVILALCSVSVCKADAEEKPFKQILVLHSYSLDTEWTRDVMEGIRSVLPKYHGSIRLDVEYMDTRRVNDRQHYENLLALYKHKAEHNSYDIVITVNSNALDFLLEHRDLYPDTPIVFCGVMENQAAELEKHRFLTGATQKKMLLPTIEIALKLHPSAEQVVLISYVRNPEKVPVMREYTNKARRRFGKRVKIIRRWLVEPSVEKLIKAIDGLDKKTIVIFTGLFKDKKGNRYIFRDAHDIILKHCKAPIYVLSKRWFGYGPIVGGKVNSGFHQGQAAAEMTLQILNGEKPENIPIMHGGLDKYIFDYVHLKRFGISKAQLPEASIVINEPQSFYYMYRGRIWAVAAIISTLSMMVVALSVNTIRRKKAEQKMLHYQTQLKSLASQLSLIEERERSRIAAELHDRIGQSLVISKISLQSLLQSSSVKEQNKRLKEACRLFDKIIQDTRSLTTELSSPVLRELGLEAAVAEWLTEQVENKYNITTEFETDGKQKPLSKDIATLLFRNVRELLINVVKHSRANKVKVSIRRSDNQIQVGVEDNGIGFELADVSSVAIETHGFGLFSIRERLEQIGGHFEIKSRPGQGTVATIMAPLKNNGSEH